MRDVHFWLLQMSEPLKVRTVILGENPSAVSLFWGEIFVCCFFYLQLFLN